MSSAVEEFRAYIRRQRTDFAAWPLYKRQHTANYGLSNIEPAKPAAAPIAPGLPGVAQYDITTASGQTIPQGTEVRVYTGTAYVLVDTGDGEPPKMVPQEWIEWEDAPSSQSSGK